MQATEKLNQSMKAEGKILLLFTGILSNFSLNCHLCPTEDLLVALINSISYLLPGLVILQRKIICSKNARNVCKFWRKSGGGISNRSSDSMEEAYLSMFCASQEEVPVKSVSTGSSATLLAFSSFRSAPISLDLDFFDSTNDGWIDRSTPRGYVSSVIYVRLVAKG